MNDQANVDVEAMREQLLLEALGSYASWSPPDLVETIGPCDPEAFARFDELRKATVGVLQEELASYPDTQIEVLAVRRPKAGSGMFLKRSSSEAQDVRGYWRSFSTDRLSELRSKRPPWYAGGFGNPDYRANFEYWCRMSRFSVEEALCLSVGVEPRHFDRRKLDELRRKDFFRLLLPLQFLLRRLELLRREFDPNSQNWGMHPENFLQWMTALELDVPSEFERLLNRYHGTDAADASKVRTKAGPDKREIDKVAQLFAAMVIEYYGYDPTQLRSPVPKEVTDLAASMGLSISAETTRKYLRMGASSIPEDWTPNSS